MRADRLYVVLAAAGARVAVAPVYQQTKKRRAHDVLVIVGALGQATAACAAATIEDGAWEITGITIAAPELAACQLAAGRAKQERELDRFAPLALFTAAQPTFRSGGRRVGSARAAA